MNEERAVQSLSALANLTRLAVMRALVQAGPEGLSAGAIAEGITASPSQTSFHLSALSEAGLITSERRSRNIIYKPDFDAFGALAAFILADCCGGSQVARSCCGLN